MNLTERPKRIALLIDADNSPANKIDLILTELATLGVANVRRAYGNWKKEALKGWEKLLHEHAIRPMQQFDYSKGKNASDMAMVIDALELLYTDRPDAFGIVSSDADFTPLVMHLRAKGAEVYGFGNQQTPKPFVNACSQFLYLDKVDTSGQQGSQQQRMSPAQLKQDAKLVSLLRHAVQAAGGEEGWAQVGLVSQQIRNQAPFDPRNYGFATFTKLLEGTQLFELKREGSVASVRERWERDGARQRPATPANRRESGPEHAPAQTPAPANLPAATLAVAAPEAGADRAPDRAADKAPDKAATKRRSAPRKKAVAVVAAPVADAPAPVAPVTPAAEPAAPAAAKPRTRRSRAKPAAA